MSLLHNTASDKGAHLVFCYATEDAPLVEELRKHLFGLRKKGHTEWGEWAIEPGAHTDNVIAEQLEKADIILLMLSAPFLAHRLEALRPYLWRESGKGQAVLVPILANACNWKAETRLEGRQLLPRCGDPLHKHRQQSKLLADIARELAVLIETLEKERAQLQIEQASAWTPTVEDDVVLYMGHPLNHDVWRTQLPGAEKLELRTHLIETPRVAWHQTEAVDSPVWSRIAADIDTTVDEVCATDFRRLHVFAAGPYGLGALLGHRLFQALRGSRALIHYQFGGGGWRPWGPEWQVSPSARRSSFFEPQALSSRQQPGVRDLLLKVGITHHVCDDEVDPVLEGLRGPIATVTALPARMGQDAIQYPDDIDPAARELEALLFKAAAEYPNAGLHLFYPGPQVILNRASSRLHLLPQSLTVYDRVRRESAFRFLPVIRFSPANVQLLVGPETGPKP